MKVAAYQAPYLPFGSFEAVALVRDQLDRCERDGVDLLCCPEAVLGGLAHERAGQDPAEVALEAAELAAVAAPLFDTPVTVIVGFTERGAGNQVFNSAAVIIGGALTGVYRKVFPGYRTAIGAGTDLPVFHHGPTPFGVIICNDLWYVEPARILTARGAAVVVVPTNSGHARAVTPSFRARGDNLPIARAVENTTTVVVADIAGRRDGREALGSSAVVDPDGIVLARADPSHVGLVVADIEPGRRPHDPRGIDGHTNPAVAAAFTDLWARPRDGTECGTGR